MRTTAKTELKRTEVGAVPKDWGVLKIEDVAEVVGGGTPSTEDPENFAGDIPWITPKDLSNYHFRFIKRGERNITRQGLKNSSARLLPKGTVLLTTRAPIGYVAIANNKVTTNQGFRSLIPKSNVLTDFLYYLLKLHTDYLKSHASGTTFGELSGSTLKSLRFAFPPIEEQRAIVSVLSRIDDKIELNQQMNKTLESIARAIFKHWFIDSEFPNEEGKPYKSSGGEMVDSELGKIPKGWKISTLREFIRIERGLSYKGAGLTEEGLPMINLANLAPNHGFIYSGLKSYSGKYKERNLVRAGDIVIANTDITQKRDVLGSPAIVPSIGSEKILFTHHVYAVRNNSWISNYFIYHLLQLKQYENRTRGFAIGTTVLFLPDDTILDFQFALPKKEIVEKFVSIFKKIQDNSELNNSASRSLTELRDSLLPRLMSGKVRVPLES